LTRLQVAIQDGHLSLLRSIDDNPREKTVKQIGKFIDTNKYVDTSFNGFCLNNSNSIEHFLGKSMNLIIDSSSGFGYIVLLNSNKTEKLTLYLYPGNSINEFSEFLVEPIKYTDKLNDFIEVSDKKFIATNGAYIGMTKRELIEKYGFDKIHLTNDNSIEIFSFEISDNLHNLFLQRYNEPAYFAKYYLDQDRIIKIEFGFVYP